MPKFATLTGVLNGAMTAHKDTQGHKDTWTQRYQKENVGVENKIRAEKNGKRPRASMSISQKAAGAFFTFIVFVVFVFTKAGGHGIKDAPDYMKIGGFHVGNDMEQLNAPYEAQTEENRNGKFLLVDASRLDTFLTTQVTKDKISGQLGKQSQIEEIKHAMDSARVDCNGHALANDPAHFRLGGNSFCSRDFATSDLETRSKDCEQDQACRAADECKLIAPTSGPIFRNADVSKMCFQLSEDVWIGSQQPHTETMPSRGAKIIVIDQHGYHRRERLSTSRVRVQFLVKPHSRSDLDFTTWNKCIRHYGQFYYMGELAHRAPSHGTLHRTPDAISIFQAHLDFGLLDMDELLNTGTQPIEFPTGRAHGSTINRQAGFEAPPVQSPQSVVDRQAGCEAPPVPSSLSVTDQPHKASPKHRAQSVTQEAPPGPPSLSVSGRKAPPVQSPQSVVDRQAGCEAPPVPSSFSVTDQPHKASPKHRAQSVTQEAPPVFR